MPYVKPTVHISRLASTALKTFTHGYAQTVVAASQSSYAAQNTSAAPLADHLIGRFRKGEKGRLQNVYTHVDGTRQAGTAGLATGRGDANPDLDKYFDAWQKHQRSGTKEWQQFQFARRLEWQPPTTVPAQQNDVFEAEEIVGHQNTEDLAAPTLKRSYTTSALDTFGKAFLDDEAAEVAALEQVNNAIAEEISRAKSPSTASIKDSALGSGSQSPKPSSETLSNADSLESDYYTNQLLQLSEDKQYGEIPGVFQGMLRAGVQKPTSTAYRALLTAAIELTHGKHLKAPKALEVYSDMLRRKVVPDIQTYGMLIGVLATRASEALSMRKALDERLSRYGGLDEAGNFMFRSTQSEYAMLVEDSSLSIALKMFERASHSTSDAIPIEACASLVIASAEQGRVKDMTRVYQYMESTATAPVSTIYPPMITAFGENKDLLNAVEVYDEYKELAIANNAGENTIVRVDYHIYAAVIKAYGEADRLKGGLKFLASAQAEVANTSELEKLREVVALEALLPLALKDTTFRDAIELTKSLTGRALTSALAKISIDAADRNAPDVSLQAFDILARQSSELAAPSMAVLAMHIRNANVEAAEPFWRILESAAPALSLIEPTTMRAVALVCIGQYERGLRQSRRMFARIRESLTSSAEEIHDQIGEAIELIGTVMLKQSNVLPPESSVELLRMMVENGGLVAPISDHLVARFTPEDIARLSQADLELMVKVQSAMILDESSADIAGPARFGCLLQTIISRSLMPSTETETVMERTLINIDNAELSKLWNSYRYPVAPAQPLFAPVVPFQTPASFEDTYDPYTTRTDVKGSNLINELLERPHGRRMNEALAKFRNMRRIGRIPRMFTYAKLIEAASKENNLDLAHEIVEMAKADVPFDARYRVVRFGWQQILDHMVAGCLNMGRRDLASRYHQDMIDMGCAPSANTFGLYITTMKENTKTFDEASEAVKIFLRAKGEGVEPSSFLYNALIGKLGKARRIDDCLFYFAEMRNLGIRPTSVTYGTIVNALCRVSDDKFAEEIFEEMESCSNYKPRPAPYHSLMQFFLSTKRDRGKVLAYYERMLSKGIEPTVHTYKLLIDTHATIEPLNMPAAEKILEDMQSAGIKPEGVHYSSLIHAKGCVQHDMDSALALFNKVLAETARPLPCVFQAVFESLNANHRSGESDALVADMKRRNVEVTPYVANALIHGCIAEGDTSKAESIFKGQPIAKREPSTYEAMVRAYLAGGERQKAQGVVKEALGRGYPGAVAGKIAELVR